MRPYGHVHEKLGAQLRIASISSALNSLMDFALLFTSRVPMAKQPRDAQQRAMHIRSPCSSAQPDQAVERHYGWMSMLSYSNV